MTETAQVERAARRGIARAKSRGAHEVSPDDLLLGALDEVSRFGIAWVGEWAIDINALDGTGAVGDPDSVRQRGSAPVYGADVVRIFERASSLAREDGSSTIGLAHLLVAYGYEECRLMDRLREEHSFSDADWRAALARGRFGAPTRVTARTPDGGGAEPEILDVEDAARYLGVHPQTVRNYVRDGRLPAYRLAGQRYIRVLRKDLLALLERVPTDESQDDEETN